MTDPAKHHPTPNTPPFHPSLAAWSVDPDRYIRLRSLPWHAVAVGALIFDARKRVLLVQRAAHDSWPLRWEVPGGAVDGGETILGGLAREVFEETGLRVVGVGRVASGRRDGRDGQDRQGGQDGDDTAKMACVFWNSSGTKLIGRFVFEVCVAEGEEVDVPPVVLDEREHCDYMWASEDVVRSGHLELTGPEQRDIILEGFRLAREAACCDTPTC